jgi:hypothetical protein
MLNIFSRKEATMQTTSAEAIRSYAEREYVEPARRKGAQRLQIIAGDVHRGMRLRNRVPNVCSVLGSRIFLERNALAIEEVSGPPSGMGTRVTYTYRLLEDRGAAADTNEALAFGKLRGLLKEGFRSLGGGETFLRRERERFYDRERTGSK